MSSLLAIQSPNLSHHSQAFQTKAADFVSTLKKETKEQLAEMPVMNLGIDFRNPWLISESGDSLHIVARFQRHYVAPAVFRSQTAQAFYQGRKAAAESLPSAETLSAPKIHESQFQSADGSPLKLKPLGDSM